MAAAKRDRVILRAHLYVKRCSCAMHDNVGDSFSRFFNPGNDSMVLGSILQGYCRSTSYIHTSFQNVKPA